jgi:hypothetical protein
VASRDEHTSRRRRTATAAASLGAHLDGSLRRSISTDRFVEAWTLSRDRVVAVGELGLLADSNLAGEDWHERPVIVASDALPAYKDLPAIPAQPILETTPSVAIAPDGSVILVGGVEDSSDSTMLRSTDAGRSWARAAGPAAGLLTSVRFTERAGLGCGPAGAILRSTDQGATWQRVASPTDLDLVAIAAAPDGHAWAVGEQGVVLRSDDAGATWTGAVFGRQALVACAFADARRGWVVGAAGTILATADGGRTFVAESLAAGSAPSRVPALVSICLAGDEPLVVVGGEGGLVLVGRGDGAWTTTRLAGETGTVTSLVPTGRWVLAATDTRHVYRAEVPAP